MLHWLRKIREAKIKINVTEKYKHWASVKHTYFFFHNNYFYKNQEAHILALNWWAYSSEQWENKNHDNRPLKSPFLTNSPGIQMNLVKLKIFKQISIFLCKPSDFSRFLKKIAKSHEILNFPNVYFLKKRYFFHESFWKKRK